MKHTIIYLEYDQFVHILKGSIAVALAFLHTDIQSVVNEYTNEQKKFISIAMPNLSTLNVIINGRIPMVISFDL